tara:strand:+ start:28981 stop:30138 length:1158 start_codon:yes stop_codon:yes gene_type:complete
MINRYYPKKYPIFLEGIVRLCYFSLFSFFKINLLIPRNKHLFLVGTRNQNVALSLVVNKVDHSLKVSFHNFKETGVYRLPEFIFYILGWVTLPFSMLQLHEVEARQRVPLIRRLERLAVSGCAIYVWKILLRIWKPLSVTVSNDHNIWTRSVLLACREIGIKTCYIPHGITNLKFPPLEADYSFLDSEIQKKNYRNNCSKVMVVGSVRFEDKIAAFSLDDFSVKNGLAICFNDHDSTEFMFDMIRKALDLKKWTIYVKMHPSDRYRFSEVENFCLENNAVFIDPACPVYNYRDRLKILLAGISGVHVDALMAGVTPCTLKSWYHEDYYQLIEDDLLFVFESLEEINSLSDEEIAQIMQSREKLNEHLKEINTLPSDKLASFYKKL